METNDELLESIFVAMDTGHPVVALLQFAKLNESLCEGGPLPSNWATRRPRVVKPDFIGNRLGHFDTEKPSGYGT